MEGRWLRGAPPLRFGGVAISRWVRRRRIHAAPLSLDYTLWPSASMSEE